MKTDNWLARNAATTPDRVALSSGGEEVTYARLEHRVAVAARRFAHLGVREGDRVVLVVEHSPELVVLLHALVRLGAVAVPLDPSLPRDELERRAAAVGARLVVTDAAQVAEAPEDDVGLRTAIDLEAVCCVVHSSGTGGAAKPVQLTFGNHLWSALGSAARIGVDPGDRWLCCLPLHHIGGLAIILRSAIYGTAVVLEPFDAKAVAPVITSERVTIASLVATTLSRLLDAGAELDRLRCVLLGGGPAPEGVIDRALGEGVPLAPTYGLTEAASQVTTLPPGEARRRPGSAGTPLLATEVATSEGAILVRGPTVAATAADADGWLRTGDLGRIEDGHLYVHGRADDVIVSGGENVSPEEVERALLGHPDVRDAGVAARPDAEWQQAVTAVVVLREGAAVGEAELCEFARERLAPHQVPKRIAFADSLPRDPQGKLRRRELTGD
jgi:O-succinylbenzoic acid--CoA ligase